MAGPSERDRCKYGICTNRDRNREETPCPECEGKEVQEVRAGQNLVCEECKEPSRMVPPPKEGPNKKLISGIVAAVVVLGDMSVGIAPSGREKGGGPIGGTNPDSIEVVSQPQEKVEMEAETSGSDTKEQVEVIVSDRSNTGGSNSSEADGIAAEDLSYAVYKGYMRDGLMNNENGVLTFKTAHVIEPRDVKKREANAGKEVVGTFGDGHLIIDTWYKNDGDREVIVP